MEQPQTEKTYKLPQQVRDYHKLKEREKRGWKCACCGGTPIVKTLETKKKLCLECLLKENPPCPSA
jgi:hypothetical protein